MKSFGINTITVNPGFFRTELLTEESTNFAERTIEDYNERRAKQMEFWKGYNGQQSGNPAKLAQALITISSEEKPPRPYIQARRDLRGPSVHGIERTNRKNCGDCLKTTPQTRRQMGRFAFGPRKISQS
jgi:hypothetical protein